MEGYFTLLDRPTAHLGVLQHLKKKKMQSKWDFVSVITVKQHRYHVAVYIKLIC